MTVEAVNSAASMSGTSSGMADEPLSSVLQLVRKAASNRKLLNVIFIIFYFESVSGIPVHHNHQRGFRSDAKADDPVD
jgi:hypothetical protein